MGDEQVRWRGEGGGFTTAGIANTENFLGDPSVDVDFAGGFRKSQVNPVFAMRVGARERG